MTSCVNSGTLRKAFSRPLPCTTSPARKGRDADHGIGPRRPVRGAIARECGSPTPRAGSEARVACGSLIPPPRFHGGNRHARRFRTTTSTRVSCWSSASKAAAGFRKHPDDSRPRRNEGKLEAALGVGSHRIAPSRVDRDPGRAPSRPPPRSPAWRRETRTPRMLSAAVAASRPRVRCGFPRCLRSEAR